MIMDTNSLYERFLKRCNKEDIPFRCIFELTFKCNLRCYHCYNNDFTTQPLSTKQIKDILDVLAFHGTFFIIFTGGEVFMREDIFDILEHANHKKFAITIFTNGTLIDDKKAKQISSYNIAEVCISIYGPNSPTHEKITRRKGSFERTINAVRFLTKYKVRVRLKTSLSKDNFNLYADIKKLAGDLGVRCQFNHITAPMRNGSEQNRYNDISTKALSRHLAKIYEEDLSYFAQNDTEPLEDLLERNVCKGGHSTFSIDPYGRLYPCLLAPYSAGNICEESFEKIWRDSSVLKQWRNIKFKDIPICNRCKLISKCAVCPVNRFLENKSLEPEKEACDLTYFLHEESKRKKHLIKREVCDGKTFAC
ncbi:MAG TPA: hypothetical protein DCY56_06985 [Candidatus Omnitrophica bacterium]|nr:hypothetical protein [Candidatus Omnitrophota bacterium]